MTFFTNFNKSKSYIRLIVIFSLLSLVFFIPHSWINLVPVEAQNYNSQIDSLSKELKKVNSSVGDITVMKDNLQEEVDRINKQIQDAENLIAQSDKTIKELSNKISSNETQVEDLTNQTKEILKQLQVSGQVSPMETILTSQTLGDLLSQIYAFSSKHSDLKIKSEELRIAIEELQENKSKQEKIKEDSEITKNVLVITKGEKNELLETYIGQEEAYQEKVKSLKSDMAELERLAAEAEKKWKKSQQQKATSNLGGTGDGGSRGGSRITPIAGNCFFEDASNPGISGFINPVPGGKISDIFGCPTPYSASWRNGHDGIDISAPYGTPIGSTAAGTIRAKGSFNVPGYGHWVMVRHDLSSGARVYSLYAHMNSSSPLSLGTSVSAGQTIGYVGSTGFSSGNHLHFMIYSQSVEGGIDSASIGCRWGDAKCYDPARFISF